MLVGIIDLGINNLTSVQRAFSVPIDSSDSIGVIDPACNLKQPDLIILPGLGSFAAGMSELKRRNLVPLIKTWLNDGSKLVGICLGMQLLGTCSEESLGVEGLNVIPSRIVRLPNNQGERIPHTGWAETNAVFEPQPFSALSTVGDFYFVHSYHMIPSDENHVLSKTPFGKDQFVSSVLSQNILGVQFHPEKSGIIGKKLISEIIDWARIEN